VLSRDGRLVLLAAGSYLGISALGYLVIVYFVSYATSVLKLPLTTALALLLTAAVAFAISIVVTGRWSDRVGRQRVMRWGNGAIVVWALVFFPLLDTRSVPLAGLAVTVMLVFQGAYIGVQPAVFSELFPTAIRYSGASVSMTLATIAGGALAPFIATALFSLAGNSSLITVYATAVALISWLSVLGLKETYQRNLAHQS